MVLYNRSVILRKEKTDVLAVRNFHLLLYSADFCNSSIILFTLLIVVQDTDHEQSVYRRVGATWHFLAHFVVL